MSSFGAYHTSSMPSGSDIDSRINARFFIDYGKVVAVDTTKGTVDVEHAVNTVLWNGRTCGSMVTKGIELLTIGAASFGLTFPVAVGDGVVLIGLKNYVATVANIQSGQEPNDFSHYNRDTMKAVPLGIVANPNVSVVVDAAGKVVLTTPAIVLTLDAAGNTKIVTTGPGLFTVKNATGSLQSILSSFETHVSVFATAIQTFAAASMLSPTVLLDPALLTAFTTLNTATGASLAQFSADIAALSLLLGA